MASYLEGRDFAVSVCDKLLEDAIEWIGKNLSPEDVFDRDRLIECAKDNGYGG